MPWPRIVMLRSAGTVTGVDEQPVYVNPRSWTRSLFAAEPRAAEMAAMVGVVTFQVVAADGGARSATTTTTTTTARSRPGSQTGRRAKNTKFKQFKRSVRCQVPAPCPWRQELKTATRGVANTSDNTSPLPNTPWSPSSAVPGRILLVWGFCCSRILSREFFFFCFFMHSVSWSISRGMSA